MEDPKGYSNFMMITNWWHLTCSNRWLKIWHLICWNRPHLCESHLVLDLNWLRHFTSKPVWIYLCMQLCSTVVIWVDKSTISKFIPEVCKANIDAYKNKVQIFPNFRYKWLLKIYIISVVSSISIITLPKKLQKYVDEQKRIFKMNLACCNTVGYDIVARVTSDTELV